MARLDHHGSDGSDLPRSREDETTISPFSNIESTHWFQSSMAQPPRCLYTENSIGSVGAPIGNALEGVGMGLRAQVLREVSM